MEPQLRRLFIVDDDEGFLFLMTNTLRKEGYNVSGAQSGEKALAWLTQNSPHLLILDLNLGDLAASALLTQLRDQGFHFPFIVITGQGDARTAVKMMKEGALDYVMKDKSLFELLPGVIHRALSIVDQEQALIAANKVILQRERRHQTIIHTALDGFARLNSKGILLEVNRALCELLDKSAETLIGECLFDVIESSLIPGVRKQITSLKHGCSLRFFTRLLSKSKTLIDVEISLHSEEREIFAFIHDISEKRRLEREILQVSEEERRRIGQELHDNLGQQLTALEFMSQSLARSLASTAPEWSKSAAEIAQHIRKTITQTRRLSHGLTPMIYAGQGLANALEELMHVINASGLKCELKIKASPQFIDDATITHLYRIAQEAVTNILKHAKAKYIMLQLSEVPGHVELCIQDDGQGIVPRKRKNGMGLQIMHYRAQLIGARLEVDSQPGKGVRIVCVLPTK